MYIDRCSDVRSCTSIDAQTYVAVHRIWVGAAAAIAAFVILPNTSPSVAYAMEQIPLLGNLIEVVTFRDYQYSSDRNNADVNVPQLVPETVASTEKTTEDPVGENLKKSTDEINAEIEKISDSLIAEFKQNMNNEGYQDIMIVRLSIDRCTATYV
mgnify:CR=1 FL=1